MTQRTREEIAAAVAAGERAVAGYKRTTARANELEQLVRESRPYDRQVAIERNPDGEIRCPVCNEHFADLSTRKPGLSDIDKLIAGDRHQRHWLEYHVQQEELRWMAQVSGYLADDARREWKAERRAREILREREPDRRRQLARLVARVLALSAAGKTAAEIIEHLLVLEKEPT